MHFLTAALTLLTSLTLISAAKVGFCPDFSCGQSGQVFCQIQDIMTPDGCMPLEGIYSFKTLTLDTTTEQFEVYTDGNCTMGSGVVAPLGECYTYSAGLKAYSLVGV